MKHFFGGYDGGWIPPGAAAPSSKKEETTLKLRIEEADGSFYLKWESSNPRFVSSDSWHKSLADAIEQAQKSFGIAPQDWEDA